MTTQYLNPDLDGECAQSSVCPLRMLEQTCSNVGKHINVSPPESVASRLAESTCANLCTKGLKRERERDREQVYDGKTTAAFTSESLTTCNKIGTGSKRSAFSPVGAAEVSAEKRQRRDCSLLQSGSENHLLLTVATGNQPTASSTPANNVARTSAVQSHVETVSTKSLQELDCAKWLELQRTMMALHAALQNNATNTNVTETYEPHGETASASKQFTCQWMACGLQFATVDELSKHLNVHVHAQSRLTNSNVNVNVNGSNSSNNGAYSAALSSALQQAAFAGMTQQNVSALPANIQQLLLSGGLLTPRASLSSSNMSPVSPLSLTPPPTATSPQSPQAALSYPNWLSLWLSRYATASAVNGPTGINVSNYAQLAMANGVLNGLTSPNMPRELVGYPVLSPYAGGLSNGNALSLLTSRFGSAV